MMRLLRSLLCVLIALSFTHSSLGTDEALKTMRKLTTEYNTMSAPAFDLLANLNIISDQSKFLLKLTGPAGSILAACIEIALKPESPTMRALAMFHDWADRKFAEQKDVTERAMKSLRMANDLNDFDNRVDIPLAWLVEVIDTATNPKTVRTAKQELVSACTDTANSPKKILKYINEKVNLNCKATPKRILPMISDLKALFAGLFSRFNEQKFMIDYYNLKTVYYRILEKFTEISETEATETFIKLRDYIEETALDENVCLLDVKKSLEQMFNGALPETCMLRSVYEGYEARRNPILTMAEIIKINTLKLAVIGGLCANISYAGDQERVGIELEKLTLYAAEITGNVSKWISVELENAWPYDLAVRATSALGLKDITDPYAYNKTANLLNTEIAARGPLNAIYTVLVTENFEKMENFWFRCPSSCCFRVMQTHGINFLMLRHEVGNSDRAKKAKQWFNSCQNNITEIIRDNDKTAELGTLTKMIEDNVGPMTSDQFYHSFVFLHVSTFAQKNCKIPIGLSSTSYLGLRGFDFLEVNDHHWAPRFEECFKLFLFL